MRSLSIFNNKFKEYSKHFSLEEVLSPDGIWCVISTGQLPLSGHAINYLNKFREFVGKPLLINHGQHKRRGYRSPTENSEVGGEPFSFHMQGVAFDISCPTLSPQELGDLAKEFGWSAVGIYIGGGFVHVDTRVKLSDSIVTWVK